MSEEETKTCNNCKLKISSQNYVIHTLHCARHLKLCNKCGEPVPKSRFKEHMSTEHVNEDCNACGESMEKRLLEKHMQSDCPKRLIICHYCELELPFNDMSAHTEYCGSRTEKCTECGEIVMLKYTQLHLDSNHKFLKLEDESGPCASWEASRAATSTANQTPLENRESTLLPCEFCNGMFSPQELRRHQVSCARGWGTTMPILRTISVVRCKHCGKSIASSEYEAHSTICSEPNLSNESNSLNLSGILCDICHRRIPTEYYEIHVSQCSNYSLTTESNNEQQTSENEQNSMISCNGCSESIPSDDYHRHRLSCASPKHSSSSSNEDSQSLNDSTLKLPCEFCEESFIPDDLAAHQICCSPEGKVATIPCEICGELKTLTEVLKHQMTCGAIRDI